MSITKNGVWDGSMVEYDGNVRIWKNVNENLLINSQNFYLSGSDFTNSTRSFGKIEISSDSRGNAYQKLNNFIKGGASNILQSTKSMTFSLDLLVDNITRTDSHGTISIDYRSPKVETYNELICDQKWHRYILPITGQNAGQTDIFIICNFYNLNGATIYYKNIKFEEGLTDTPWIPAESEYSMVTASGVTTTANNFYEF